MGSVRDHCGPAWVAHGPSISARFRGFTDVVRMRSLGGLHVSTSIYIGLTIVVFAALFLLVKGVERFER